MQVLENYLSKLDSLADNASAFVDPLAIVEDLQNLTFQGGLSESDLSKLQW